MKQKNHTLAQSVEGIEGAWDLIVTLRSCETGAPVRTFRAMNTFYGDGALIESAEELPLRGTGQGAWRHVGGANYSAVLRFFRFDPKGNFVGTERVTRNIELNDNASEFRVTAAVEVFDVHDNLIQSGCATATARR